VSEYRKELLKSAIVAIMSASLLGAATYHLVQPRQRPIIVAFALGEGRQFSADCSASSGFWLSLNFTFLNGSVITRNPYCGEFNATELQKISVRVHGFAGFDFDESILRFMTVYVQNRTIDATIADQGITALGSSKNLGNTLGCYSTNEIFTPEEEDAHRAALHAELDRLRSYFNVTRKELPREERLSTGYWKTYTMWEITMNQLDEMLHGSGTANITFTVGIDIDLYYKITTTSGGNLTDSTDLSWSGTGGTLQLTHEEGKISWVKYNFTTVKLIMLVTE